MGTPTSRKGAGNEQCSPWWPSRQDAAGSGGANRGECRGVPGHGAGLEGGVHASAHSTGTIGLSASTVSRQFIEASAARLRELSKRGLSGFEVVALGLDGKTSAKDAMVTALGVMLDGHRMLLGFVQSSTENAEAMAPFLQGLLDRGLKIDQGILVVLDGGKGLRAAV